MHGHCDVPHRYKDNPEMEGFNPDLGNWVRRQRHFYHLGTASKEKIEKLDAIGFRWVIPANERWIPLSKR